MPPSLCTCAAPSPHPTAGKCGHCGNWTDTGFAKTCGYCGLPPREECPVMGVPCDVNGRMVMVGG